MKPPAGSRYAENPTYFHPAESGVTRTISGPSRLALTSRLIVVPPRSRLTPLRCPRRGRYSRLGTAHRRSWSSGAVGDERRKMPVTHFGIAIGRRHDRILLRLDDEPAAIVVAPQDRDQRAEIDGPVAGHGECAVDHGFEEAPVAVAREPDHVGPHVLAVHVANTRDVLLEYRDCITARERHVAAVEQQADFVAGVRHEAIDVRRRLHVR